MQLSHLGSLSKNFSSPEGNFRENQLLHGSISLSTLHPGHMDIRLYEHQDDYRYPPEFPLVSPLPSIVYYLSGPSVCVHVPPLLYGRWDWPVVCPQWTGEASGYPLQNITNVNPLCPAKLSTKIEEEIKTSHYKNKLRKFMTIKPAPRRLLEFWREG